MFAGSLLVAFMAAFTLTAAAGPAAELAAQAQAAPAFWQPYPQEVSPPREAIPEHAPTCFERHNLCGPDGIASAPAASVALGTMPGTRLVKAPALLPAPMPDVAPHAAVSLTILFRNFRE